MTTSPRILELAERGRKATVEAARTIAAPAVVSSDAGERYRAANPPGSIRDRAPCVVCGGNANVELDGARACCWCGWRSVLEQGEWRTVGRCMLFTGAMPGQEGSGV